MKVFVFALLTLLSFAAAADQSVRGYTRKDGTYVQPHMRSSPNSTRLDNFSTQGNVNPYTGQPGTVNPYSVPTPKLVPNPYSDPNASPNPYGR